MKTLYCVRMLTSLATAHDDEQIGDVIDLGQFDTGKPGLSDGSPVADYNATNPNFGGVKPMSLLLHITESMVGGTSVIFRLYSAVQQWTVAVFEGDNLQHKLGVICYSASRCCEGLQVSCALSL